MHICVCEKNAEFISYLPKQVLLRSLFLSVGKQARKNLAMAQAPAVGDR
ncbi:hypothetical protein [Nostoc punctiforme]|nr:hypothetical protein [Nostoc punctiforme]